MLHAPQSIRRKPLTVSNTLLDYKDVFQYRYFVGQRSRKYWESLNWIQLQNFRTYMIIANFQGILSKGSSIYYVIMIWGFLVKSRYFVGLIRSNYNRNKRYFEIAAWFFCFCATANQAWTNILSSATAQLVNTNKRRSRNITDPCLVQFNQVTKSL